MEIIPTEETGFEPAVLLHTQTFQVCTISRSDTLLNGGLSGI